MCVSEASSDLGVGLGAEEEWAAASPASAGQFLIGFVDTALPCRTPATWPETAEGEGGVVCLIANSLLIAL